MELCVNTILTDKYYDNLDKIERMQDEFEKRIEPYLQDIRNAVKRIEAVKAQYDHDFDEFAEDLVRDCL